MKLLPEPLLVEINTLQGTIFNIKRFAVHDGPGIRTTIFLKGCPLKCAWCHNPEGMDTDIELWYNHQLCMQCGQCVEICPENALTTREGENPFIFIDHKKCNLSGECVQICPTRSLQYTGETISLERIFEEIDKDILFYEMSGGGVTISGGEPLYQIDFCKAILSACRERKISTTVDTSLYCSKEDLDAVVDFVDVFLVDLKLFDSSLHEHHTRKDNNIILANFRYLDQIHKNIIVRIPMIKNITDKKENIEAIEKYVNSVNPEITIEHIPFNPLAKNKYCRLGLKFSIES